MAYWLMKSEPDTYSIDHLMANSPNMWEGCRNYIVRNYLRDEMKEGDLAFFYHSSCPEPGIVGVMKIVGEAYTDRPQWGPPAQSHDPKSPKEKPRWFVRDVDFVRKFGRLVSLPEMREMAALQDMVTLKKGNRLSITRVSDDEWAAIMNLPGL